MKYEVLINVQSWTQMKNDGMFLRSVRVPTYDSMQACFF